MQVGEQVVVELPLTAGITLPSGVVSSEPRMNTMSFTPFFEAIEAFKAQSAVYSAEHGFNSGAQVNVAIGYQRSSGWFNTAAFVRSKCDGCAGEGIHRNSLNSAKSQLSEHAAVQCTQPYTRRRTFGRITSTITSNREMQFGLKYSF